MKTRRCKSVDKVRILHCADLHIGSNLSSLGRKASARKAELKNTLIRILREAKAEPVDLFLVPGDLFDSVSISEQTLEEIRDAFQETAPVRILIAPGNHDPFTEDSPYHREGFWPENVFIFKGELDYIEIEDKKTRIWGAAFQSSYERTGLLREPVLPEDDWVNICLMHGTLVGKGQGSDYNPVTREAIARSGFDYLALGHIHERMEPEKEGETVFAYPGCPEGRGFDELGEKGYYFGEVGKGYAKLKFRPISRRQNIEIKVDVSSVLSSREAAKLIETKLKERCGEDYRENLYKVILTGSVPERASVRPEELKALLPDLYYLKIRDLTEIEFDISSVSQETTLRGIFMRKLLEQAEKHSDDPKKYREIQMALKLGLKSFTNEVTYYEN